MEDSQIIGLYIDRDEAAISETWKKNHRQKRYAGMEQLLNELEDCIPSPVTVEREIEEQELTGIINSWLMSLPQDDRILFMRRYWNGETVAVLAQENGTSPANMANENMCQSRHLGHRSRERKRQKFCSLAFVEMQVFE